MEPTLMVVGLNHRTAPISMRERFWIGETGRYDVLRQLKTAEGIEEAFVLCNCCRTEFVLWANEPTLAANSLLHFLGTGHGLKLTEWERFYRLLDEAALLHIFRVTSGLDSQLLCESQVASQVEAAWEQARTVGAAARFLNAVLEKALSISKQVRLTTSSGKAAVSIPTAALQLVRQIFGSLEGRRVLLLGSSAMAEGLGRYVIENGAASLVVLDQSAARAQEFAQALGGSAATLADRWNYMLRADIVISASGCPHVILTRGEAERIALERNRAPLVILDLGMPRDVDPEVRRVDGVLLYDLEGLEREARNCSPEPGMGHEEAEKIVAAEAVAFRGLLHDEQAVPVIVGLRRRLEEICRQELDSFVEERGPFSREQSQSLHAITNRFIQKIATSLHREIKEVRDKEEQEQTAAAIARLFHLGAPQTATAGTTSEKSSNEQRQNNAIAINY